MGDERLTKPEFRGPIPRWIVWLLPSIDRLLSRIIGIKPVDPVHGLMGISSRRHRGASRVLSDDTTVRPGSRLLDIHVLNHRLAHMKATSPSKDIIIWDMTTQMSRDMAILARKLEAATDIEALHALTLLESGVRRLGFSVTEDPSGLWAKLTAIYMLGLMQAYNPPGAQRMIRKDKAIVAKEIWMSRQTLLARYGSKPPAATVEST